MARNRAYDAPAYDRGTTPRKLNPRTRWRELTTWGADAEREGAVTTMDVAEASTPKSTVKFPVREDLNTLVRAFECGEEESSSPWLLDVEVVTCAARESMARCTGARSCSGSGIGHGFGCTSVRSCRRISPHVSRVLRRRMDLCVLLSAPRRQVAPKSPPRLCP